jgi:hypothetical protein
VLVLEIRTFIHFGMLLKGLGLVEEVRPLSVLHWNRGIIIAIYDPDNISVCLSTVRYKSLELGHRDTVLFHNIIQVPKYTLSSSLL